LEDSGGCGSVEVRRVFRVTGCEDWMLKMMSLVKIKMTLASNSFGLSPTTNYLQNTVSSRNIRHAEGGREREREDIRDIHIVDLFYKSGS
jgi:hypothetical protein